MTLHISLKVRHEGRELWTQFKFATDDTVVCEKDGQTLYVEPKDIVDEEFYFEGVER